MATVKNTSFELKGADGGPLRGTVWTVGDGKGRPAVVVCHGFKGFKDWGFFPHLAHRLANAGLTTVTFNFSGVVSGPTASPSLSRSASPGPPTREISKTWVS